MSESNIPKSTSEFGSRQKLVRQLDYVNWGRTTQKSSKSFSKMSPTEETSAAVQDEFDHVTTCCICDETFTDPVILPCVHTFCLTCLLHIGTYTNKNLGELMPCPICRQEFTIPENGYAALKKNFFMVKLIEITTTQQGASGVCDKHEHENLCLYCSDCSEVMCLECLSEFHHNHRLSELRKAANILRSQLQSNVSTAKHCQSDALKKKERLLQKNSALLEKIQGFETEVDQVRRDLKALIDRHADSLLENLEFIKKERIEDIEVEEKELDEHLDCLKNFEMCCAGLASNYLHESLFCNMASKLKELIAELELVNKSIVECQPRSFDIHFTKTLEVYKAKNVIGVVKAKIDYIGKPELVATIGADNTAVNEGVDISGMAVSYNDVFIAYEKNPVVSIYDSYTHKCITQLTLNGFVHEMDLRHCISVAGNVYIVNGMTREILRVDQNRDFMKWSTRNDCGRLSVSAESTIVATCYETNTLREYSLQGTLLHEIKLCSTIVHPLHAIKLGNGHFVVSHGSSKHTFNRVCMVNVSGGITKSFGGWRGSSNQQLDAPTCLAVDENGNILVLDMKNSRVLLLSPSLEFKLELLTKTDGLRRPVAMHLDETNGLLYIADNNWENFPRRDSKVLVFNVK